MVLTDHRSSWLPLLSETGGESRPHGFSVEGDLAKRINSALDDLAEALARPAPDFEPSDDLANGPAGAALFFHYLDQARPGMGYDVQALAHLETAIESTAAARSSPALFTGFTGIAWTLEHLTGRPLDPPDPGEVDAGAEVARALTGYLRNLPRYDGYDLFSGLAGVGVWALERGSRSGAAEAVDGVVRHLGERAERQAGGITWHTPPESLIPAARAKYPHGCYKPGVAHGIAGVIGVLGAMRAAGLETGAARELLAGAVEWLLGQRLPPGADSRFPGAVAPGAEPAPGRLTWCRGDIGIALALLVAARAAGEPEWERQALAIAREAASHPPDLREIRDGGLCHGAAGLAHLYNRLFHATGDPLFEAEAVAWIERLLARRQPGRGVAGWLSWEAIREISAIENEFDWLPLPGFLTGAAGIGLSLLGAVSPVEPAWDRLLLCSVPPVLQKVPAQKVSADIDPCSWHMPRPLYSGETPGKENNDDQEGEEGPHSELRDAPAAREQGDGGDRQSGYSGHPPLLLPVGPDARGIRLKPRRRAGSAPLLPTPGGIAAGLTANGTR